MRGRREHGAFTGRRPAPQDIEGRALRHAGRNPLVPIVVAHAAIEAIEPVPNWSGDHLIDFAKYRSIFEQIASDKHARGQIEDDGSIVIQAGDR